VDAKVGKFKKASAENRFLLEMAEVMETWKLGTGKKELSSSGGWWRMKFRAEPDKMRRILADVGGMIKEGKILDHPGKAAVDLWERLP